MKKMAIFVALALSALISNAQEVIKLEEANVSFNPISQNITNQGNFFSVNIKESYSGEFTKDPVAFMKAHFDIKEVISNLGVKDYDSYEVTFKSRKGVLNAEFDAEGNILGTSLRFKNIMVPSPLQHQLYRDYKGWAMVKNLHIASELYGKPVKDFYKVTMKKGNQTKKLKINSSDIGKSTLVALK